MTVIETLMQEHRIILMVLEAAEREARFIQETGTIHPEKIKNMVEFFREFADRCHHMKEEGHLFKKMQERGMSSESGPLVVMLHEHDEGRHLVRLIDELRPQAAGEAPSIGDTQFCCSVTSKSAAEMLSGNLLSYARLLREHIYKEDNVLYKMAERLLSSKDAEALEQAFEKVEAEEVGEGIHERYHKLAHELADK